MTAPRKPILLLTDVDRFLSRTEPEPNTGCWLWTAGMDTDGYGVVWNDGRVIRAHRLSFMLFVDCNIIGKKILHKCDNPPCVNPDHLFSGTHQDNMTDMALKRRGAKSPNGLPFGVRKAPPGNHTHPYRAEIRIGGKVCVLGYFESVAAAAVAADIARSNRLALGIDKEPAKKMVFDELTPSDAQKRYLKSLKEGA